MWNHSYDFLLLVRFTVYILPLLTGDTMVIVDDSYITTKLNPETLASDMYAHKSCTSYINNSPPPL